MILRTIFHTVFIFHMLGGVVKDMRRSMVKVIRVTFVNTFKTRFT